MVESPASHCAGILNNFMGNLGALVLWTPDLFNGSTLSWVSTPSVYVTPTVNNQISRVCNFYQLKWILRLTYFIKEKTMYIPKDNQLFGPIFMKLCNLTVNSLLRKEAWTQSEFRENITCEHVFKEGFEAIWQNPEVTFPEVSVWCLYIASLNFGKQSASPQSCCQHVPLLLVQIHKLMKLRHEGACPHWNHF